MSGDKVTQATTLQRLDGLLSELLSALMSLMGAFTFRRRINRVLPMETITTTSKPLRPLIGRDYNESCLRTRLMEIPRALHLPGTA
ncbi:unnamed protein product [Cyprideis torosa]|uniref:Uncharacterized protein n=1 Tax=Cyprideis torosa TaxID=163714 RepID=A0A7R8WJD4_9CRUS|nr:unnamed protein product [Cyprideis torosa]CAG0895822.1 unnamed protein product [Cyprideis torosa]